MFIVLFAAPVRAQERPARPDSTEVIDAEREPLLSIQDAYLAAGFAATALALYPLDKAVAEELQDSTVQAVDFARNAAKALSAGGSSPVWLAGSATLYAIGRISASEAVAETGLHATQAVVVSTVVTGVLKSVAGRARPLLGVDSPHDFSLGRGFGDTDYQSFPSGHTTGAFAAASAITSEVNRHWPAKVWYVGPTLYGTAALVGMSRMYNNKHWASDVVVGAAVGVFSGLKVVSYNHAHPDNRLEKWLLPTSAFPDGQGGIALGWQITMPIENPR
jgi:membrane-associated phospholipid phosphatase